MQKYVFVKLLEQPPKNSVFHRKDWPLHVTVVPLFAIDMDEEDLLALVKEATEGLPPATAVASSDEMFGPNHNLRVTILDMSPELTSMHVQLYEQLVNNGATFSEPQYCGKNYRAHATVQDSGRLQQDEKVLIDELSFIDMFHDQDINQRRVIDTIKLKG